ncbi:MAG: patatin-like phospholipase family protein [Rhodothermales bacterium]
MKVLTSLLVMLILAGCASTPERELSQKTPMYAALPNGHDPLNPDRLSPMYVAMTSDVEGNFMRHLERKQGHALNLLSLSGGGQNGAFGAGFLIGWRESGRRPELDVVTGVSTGALLATHALLGTPADDAIIEEMYTQVTKKNIFENRSIFGILSGADSLRDTAPLRSLIAKHITAETLQRVATAFDNNRLILVGTTNIDYAQTWVWNMSLLAKHGKLDLYREVLLASASFPIVFSPVEIEGHLFIDGAARSNLVVPGMAGSKRPKPPLYGPGNLYLISNGRLKHPPEALRRALGDVAATTVGVMMDQSMQTALTRSYFGAQFLGYTFKMIAIPDDVEIGRDPLAFDPKQMRAAFDTGRALAKQPDPWSSSPPNVGDIPPWAMDAFKARN